MPIIPGQRLGAYDVIALLGAGGMGQVYRAFDTRLQREIALKTIQTNDPDHRRRFEREALAVAALNHPNIVTIHSVEEVEGMPFLTMELVDGEPLNHLIPSGGLPLQRLLQYAIPITEALTAAHGRGIVHRDLKPANVMVTRDGRVKMLDFGLAKALSTAHAPADVTGPQTREGVVIGTLAYMSPEQVSAQRIDERSDIFTMGLLLYEMATGRRAFEGPNEAAILVALLNRPVPAVGGGHGELDRVIARASAKKATARYPRAIDLLDDLRALSTGTAPRAPVVTRAPVASVAVLPFTNMSADADQEYFCDGMAEELINALMRIKGLSVAARTSAFQFKGQAIDVREVGERLKVQSILEGSVRRMGNRLRITAQLINVSDGYQLWSDRYDRTMDDVFAIQDEIARAITDSLKVALSRSGATPLMKPGTASVEAYNEYLRGRFLMNQLTDLYRAHFSARACFERAIELDPEFAAAYAGLSECCNALGYFTFVPPEEASAAAMAAAEKAIALDPGLAEAHTALGWTKTLFVIDLQTAEQDFLRAIDLAPSYAPAHAYYALLLAAHGRFDEALVQVDEARQFDPLWLVLRFITCHINVCARQFDVAIEIVQEIMALNPSFPGAYWYLSLGLAGQGRFEEAAAQVEQGAALVQRAPLFVGLLGLWYARAGRRAEAEAVLRELVDGGHCPPAWLAIVYGGLGDLDNAFHYLERAIDERNDQIFLMGVEIRFDPLRDDPRFDRLLQRIGLPPRAA